MTMAEWEDFSPTQLATRQGPETAAPVVENQMFDGCCAILFQILNKQTRSASGI